MNTQMAGSRASKGTSKKPEAGQDRLNKNTSGTLIQVIEGGIPGREGEKMQAEG